MELFRFSKPIIQSFAVIALASSLASCVTTDGATDAKESKSAKASVPALSPDELAYQKIGKPYEVKGKWYTPKADEEYSKTGLASWYGADFHGGRTASGEVYDKNVLSAAHKTLPLPSYVRVTNLDNDSSVVVRVNDRGPFVSGRIIDVSKKAAEMLDMTRDGVANVRVDYIGPAKKDPDDMDYLMATYHQTDEPAVPQGVNPERFGDNTIQIAQAKPESSGRDVNSADARTENPAADATPTTALALVDTKEPALPTNVPIPVPAPFAVATAQPVEAAPAKVVPDSTTVALLTADNLFPAQAPIPLKR